MVNEVSYNQSVSNQDWYGYGVVQVRKPNLDMTANRMPKGGVYCDKEPIRYNPHEKVMPNAPNHFKDYMNDSIDSLNFEERAEERVETGLLFTDGAATENLDFDMDGVPDMDMYDLKVVPNKKATEVAEDMAEVASGEAIAEVEAPINHIEEKSVKFKEPEVVVKESHMEIVNPKTKSAELASEQEKPKTFEKPHNDMKSVTANISNKQISMSDGIIMGAGGLAMAMMIMGRAGAGL